MVKFREVTKKYLSNDGIFNVSFTIRENERVGLFGINGSGKTTTLKLICGLLQPTNGTITVVEQSPKQQRGACVFLSDKNTFFSWMDTDDVADLLVALFPDFCREMFSHLLAELDVPHKAVAHLSKGQLQRLKIAAAFSQKAKVYLLDEPLGGVDIFSKQKILEIIAQQIKREGSVTFFSTHEIQGIAPFLNRVLIFVKGRMVRDIQYEYPQQGYEYLLQEFTSATNE